MQSFTQRPLTSSHRALRRVRPFLARVTGPLLLATLASGCDAPAQLGWPGALGSGLESTCTIDVEGTGEVDFEADYLPHVVNCENGAADGEALKAQAVAARSYALYRLATGDGTIGDGEQDQVYSCGRTPGPQHVAAVQATRGQVLAYDDAVIAAFYVAGAIPSSAMCVATEADMDPHDTERYVTYNQGRTGDGVTQSPLGWVDPRNTANRGCMSQNGAHCLASGGMPYTDILAFYYGQDIVLSTASSMCGDDPCVDDPCGAGCPLAGSAMCDTGSETGCDMVDCPVIATLEPDALGAEDAFTPVPGGHAAPSADTDTGRLTATFVPRHSGTAWVELAPLWQGADGAVHTAAAVPVTVHARGGAQRVWASGADDAVYWPTPRVQVVAGTPLSVEITNGTGEAALGSTVAIGRVRLRQGEPGEAELGRACDVHTECAPDLLCTDGVCSAGCEITGCGDGQHCLLNTGVCSAGPDAPFPPSVVGCHAAGGSIPGWLSVLGLWAALCTRRRRG